MFGVAYLMTPQMNPHDIHTSKYCMTYRTFSMVGFQLGNLFRRYICVSLYDMLKSIDI